MFGKFLLELSIFQNIFDYRGMIRENWLILPLELGGHQKINLQGTNILIFWEKFVFDCACLLYKHSILIFDSWKSWNPNLTIFALQIFYSYLLVKISLNIINIIKNGTFKDPSGKELSKNPSFEARTYTLEKVDES